MHQAIPEADLGGGAEPSDFAPTVVLSRAALHANLSRELAVPGAARLVDVRRRAWGHGAAFVAGAAVEAGADGVRVEPGPRRPDLGVDAAFVRDAGATLDPRAVLGLPLADGTLAGRPVLSLRGRVLSVKPLRAGEGVSYGYTHHARVDTRVALVTGGYGQGVVRLLGNRVRVGIRGRRHPIVGRVAMDVSVVDVGASEVERGDEVLFFGDPATGAPPLADWASATGMTAAELVWMVGARAEATSVTR